MKLLIENQCLYTFLGITLFVLFFLHSNGGLIRAHVITLHDAYTHPGIHEPSKIYL